MFFPGTLQAGGACIRTDDGAVMTPSYAFVDASLAGNTVLVPAQGAGVGVRVLGLVVVASPSTVARLQQNVGGATANITAGHPVATNGGWVMPFSPLGWCVSSANGSVNLNLDANVVAGATCIWMPAVV